MARREESMEFKTQMEKWNLLVNNTLDDYLTINDGPGSNLCKAMKYSLMAGGKRLRPVLALAVCDMLGGDGRDVLPFACALEMIHTYSLIHDDLPAMDNDDFRRGIPTNHKVFGEAMAILAGDALLNKAFEVMLAHAGTAEGRPDKRIQAMGIIARSAGAEGMIRGQVVDLESEGLAIGKETLEYMHRCKTGALIKAPVLAAAVLAGANDREYKMLEIYAENIGLAFQIKDDIMDVKGSLEQMGKAAGSDAAANKSTYVTLFGVDEAEALLDRTIRSALDALDCFGGKAWFLKELALYIQTRTN
jgi:geranylgeranyl diphosphate synthase type II